MPEWEPLIFIVEDDMDMARLNARLLKRQGYNTLVAHTAAKARLLVSENQPDLFVLDIELPDGNGLSLCKEFRRNSDAPVLFLTGKSSTEDKITGLDTGGDYYLTKPYDRNEFIAVIQCLLRRVRQTRKKIDDVSIITKGSLTIKLFESKAYIDGRDAELTRKEYALLLLLVQNENRELTREQLYENIWGVPMNNDANSIRLLISRLKKKIREDEASDFSIFTEYGKGYTFRTYLTK